MATVPALTVKILHRLGKAKEGFTVEVSLEQTQSLFDVLVNRIAETQYWILLEVKENKMDTIAWRDRAKSALDFKPYLDEYIQEVFMRPERPTIEVRLRHNDTRRSFVTIDC
jgi:hypothetical protein